MKKQRISTFQLRKRREKRNRLKPIRMAWRVYLKKEVNYDASLSQLALPHVAFHRHGNG